MNKDKFKTPATAAGGGGAYARSTAAATAKKRDTAAAELERDPQTSTAKRQQRSQAFTSHMAHAALERKLATAETARIDLETKLREKELQVEQLERDRRWLAEREERERTEKERERKEHEQTKRELEDDLRTTRSALHTLRSQHDELEEDHASLSRSTSHTISSQAAQLSTLNTQLASLERALAESEQLATSRAHKLAALQDEVDDLRARDQDASRTEADTQTWSVVREELSRQTAYVRQLEGANAKMSKELAVLRERKESVEVVREQKRELERKLAAMGEMRERVVRLEGELEAARAAASSQALSLSASQSSNTAARELQVLRTNHARLLEEHGSTSALLKLRDTQLAEAERRENEILEMVEQMEPQIRSLKDKIARREQRVAVAAREVEGLKALLASYAEEAAQQSPAAAADAAQTQRVTQLDTLLAEYKTLNDQLQSELDRALEQATGTAPAGGTAHQKLSVALDAERAARTTAERELEDARTTIAALEKQMDALEQRLFELQGEIGGGRHVPPGVRVLEMRDNPAQRWTDLRQEVMDRLKGENEALLGRLRELEERAAHRKEIKDEANEDGKDEKKVEDEAGEGAGELVPRASWEVVQKEKRELEEVVRQKEKRLLRLQQVFTAKSAEFKEAIAAVLGLKLAFYPNGQVRVTSRYDLSCSFVFQPAKDGSGSATMQLVAQGEGGPEDLGQWMRNWIEKEQCIPGFLATVTLECYDRWKTMRDRGELEE